VRYGRPPWTRASPEWKTFSVPLLSFDVSSSRCCLSSTLRLFGRIRNCCQLLSWFSLATDRVFYPMGIGETTRLPVWGDFLTTGEMPHAFYLPMIMPGPPGLKALLEKQGFQIVAEASDDKKHCAR